ncbi:MAG: hypothetical protein K2M36_01270 [Clostridia bacterium]|nr:hypothetical protein [Clostridia bacterium]
MYTRCPSCGAEISFEPPANRESLPEDYKHRIRCPICGVTIGVKINKPIYATTTFPAYGNQSVATSFEPVLAPQNVSLAPQQQEKALVSTQQNSRSLAVRSYSKTAEKKSGIGRNIVMMVFSLVFVALTVLGYLFNNGIIKTGSLPEAVSWLLCISNMDGITPIQSMIKDFASFQKLFANIGVGIMTLAPSALFVFACLNFIVALISAIGKKYGRAYNLIVSVIICALMLMTFFAPYVLPNLSNWENLLDYFKYIIANEYYLMFAAAGWGVLQLLFSLFFLTSLKKTKKTIHY